MKTMLQIPAIAGNVHLGCTPQERKKPQPVQLQIHIEFAKPPKALETDSLKDTPCYAEMTHLALLCFRQKHYATIEHLCLCCHQTLKKYLQKKKMFKKSVLSTTLHKLAPPVKEIVGGSVFRIQQKI
jgi:dihydroneopterin aldolase